MLAFFDSDPLQRNPLGLCKPPIHNGSGRALPIVVFGFQLPQLIHAEELDAGEALNAKLSCSVISNC